MTRTNWILGAIAALGLCFSLWQYRANRALRDELDGLRVSDSASNSADDSDPTNAAKHRTGEIPRSARFAPPPPVLGAPSDLKLDRRARKLTEFTAIFGRLDNESDADYRARIGPLLAAGLAIPRAKVTEMRKQAEAKANVTPDQSRALDQAFEKTYGSVIDYANGAIADGALSPYKHDMAGWLQFAGGLGTILNDSQGQLGQILSPDQLQAMSAAGFDWGEYLGTEAPWEKLGAPPPPKQ
jgi:hypothetical protein